MSEEQKELEFSQVDLSELAKLFFPPKSPFKFVKNSDGWFTFHDSHPEIVGDAETQEESLKQWHLAYELYYEEPYKN
jgi:hypothetical protein